MSDATIGVVGLSHCLWLLGCIILLAYWSTYEDPERPDAFPLAALAAFAFLVLLVIESWALWQIVIRDERRGYIALGSVNVIPFGVGIWNLVVSDEPLDWFLFLITVTAGLVSCLCLASAIRVRT